MLNVPFADFLVISLAIGGVCIWWNQGPRKRIVAWWHRRHEEA